MQIGCEVGEVFERCYGPRAGLSFVEEQKRVGGERFAGAVVGRFGNRIYPAEVEIDGQKYQLTVNERLGGGIFILQEGCRSGH